MSKAKTIVQQHKPNFLALRRAFRDGNVVLMECKRKSDGELVAVICTIHWDGKGYQVTPFAELPNGDPFDLYDPPNPEGGF